jgi:hypothetical protein
VLVPSTKPQTNGTDHGALTRLYELYVTEGLSYERTAALLAEMPPAGPTLTPEMVGLQAAQTAILTAPATILRGLVQALYTSITITPDGLEFSPKEWCADWA